MGLHHGGEVVLHQPVDAGHGIVLAQRRQNSDRSADVSQSAGADNEDSLVLGHRGLVDEYRGGVRVFR